MHMKSLVFLFLMILNNFFYSQNDNVVLLGEWTKSGMPFCYDGESVFNEVWGVDINNQRFGVIGSTMGTHFINIGNDNSLTEIDFVLGKYAGVDAIHRDYHDYNGYLYAVCDENYSSLQIMDMRHLPDSVSIVYDSSTLIIRAHNIFIDTAKARLYACSVNSPNGFLPLAVYDLSNPISPSLIGTYDAVGHVHDAYVINDTAYLNCGNEGLKVVKFNDIGIPIQLGELNLYTDKGYNHAGWLSGDGISYVMCDETPSMDVKVLDVSDLDDIKVRSTFSSNFYDETLPHNVIVRNQTAYVSYYNDGLQIFDISNPSNPKKIGYYDSYSGSNNLVYRGAWGVYPFGNGDKTLVSDRKRGLLLLGFNPPPIISENPFFIFPNPATDFIYFYKNHIGEADYELSIYNSLGQLVESFISNNDYYLIDLKQYNTGVYLYQYISSYDNQKLSGKFFVE
jgi:choice-of-anchor B domain-containing protein